MKVRLSTSSLLLFRILLGLLLHHVSAQETRGGVGKTKPSGESRIIGGSQATDGRYPYAVSLVSGGSHFCGGAYGRGTREVHAGLPRGASQNETIAAA